MSEHARGYEIEDLLRFKNVYDPQISPDGSRVAYCVREIDADADTYRTSIWAVPTAGGDVRRLARGGRTESQPRWSPDGRFLAFTSDRAGGSPQLYLMPASGGEAQRLTDLPRGVSEPAWSPDSRSVAFLSRTGGAEPVKPGATAPPIVITSLKHKFDGQGYFDGSHPHIFVIAIDSTTSNGFNSGGEPRQLTDGEWDDGQIAWSPDGGRIAFVSARHADRDRDAIADVWVVAADGGEPRALTERFGPCSGPAFSPDGRTVAFSGHRQPQGAGQYVSMLWTVPAEGGAARCLTPDLDRNVKAGPPLLNMAQAPLCWTRDGTALLALVEDRANIHLYRIATSGGATRLLGGERCIDAFSVAADGRIACAIGDQQHASEVWILSAIGGGDAQERRLTTTNDALLGELRLPKIEAIAVTMPDGAVIEGWVYKPLDLQPGRRYPLVLNVHGGPHGAFLHRLLPGYTLALPTQGCGVLQINPRGSTGWGEKFSSHLHGAWGGERDMPEFMAAIDQVIDQGWVDPDRLGITGYSYGGIFTNWAVSHTNRFKAAVTGAGAANIFSHWGYSDMNVVRFAELDGSPWEQRELYQRLSALSYVPQIETPILLLHGADDQRVNFMQASEFFSALKYFGKEVVLVRYPGESHGMLGIGKPSHRLDYDRRLVDWFSRYLHLGRVEQRETVVAD
jgi:dipeptidyl aminopeptidase/acylaminoacyl peptidase